MSNRKDVAEIRDPPEVGNAVRFLADLMLIRLGRWLRAAGYDTAVADHGVTDRQLLERAVLESRLLVTRDRKLTEFRDAPGRVVLLRSNGVAACASELTGRLQIDWLYRPFTRCLLCNAPLAEAACEPGRSAPPVPEDAEGPVTRCPECDKLYWQGSHARRMRRRLGRWRAGDFG